MHQLYKGYIATEHNYFNMAMGRRLFMMGARN